MGEEKETAIREEQAGQPGRSNRFKILSIGAALIAFALIYWLLSREVLKLRGETTDDAWAEANDLEDWKSTF